MTMTLLYACGKLILEEPYWDRAAVSKGSRGRPGHMYIPLHLGACVDNSRGASCVYPSRLGAPPAYGCTRRRASKHASRKGSAAARPTLSPHPSLLVLRSWVGVRRPFHLSVFLTASRMVLLQDPSTDALRADLIGRQPNACVCCLLLSCAPNPRIRQRRAHHLLATRLADHLFGGVEQLQEVQVILDLG